MVAIQSINRKIPAKAMLSQSSFFGIQRYATKKDKRVITIGIEIIVFLHCEI